MKVYGNIFIFAVMFIAAACGNMGLTHDELRTIGSAGSNGIMRVLTVYDKADSLVLRTPCADFSEDDLTAMFADSLSPCAMLASQMVATVTSPEQDGVGIAGPQVGISRRIVAVQRFDKPGNPFEVYPNIRILEARGNRRTGAEGCLSIPGRRGIVERWDTVVIRYAKAAEALRADADEEPVMTDAGENPAVTDAAGDIASVTDLEYVTETVGGFTAVIFQHECDHLDGILYPDREKPEVQM